MDIPKGFYPDEWRDFYATLPDILEPRIKYQSKFTTTLTENISGKEGRYRATRSIIDPNGKVIIQQSYLFVTDEIDDDETAEISELEIKITKVLSNKHDITWKGEYFILQDKPQSIKQVEPPISRATGIYNSDREMAFNAYDGQFEPNEALRILRGGRP